METNYTKTPEYILKMREEKRRDEAYKYKCFLDIVEKQEGKSMTTVKIGRNPYASW